MLKIVRSMKNLAVLTEDRAFALFFRPHPGGEFDSSRVSTPGNLPSKAKKMLLPGSQPGGGGLGAGEIGWCITSSWYQIAFKWSVNFWLQLSSIRLDGKYINVWNFYLDMFQIQKNWAGRNFITISCVYSLLITQAKMQTEINNN